MTDIRDKILEIRTARDKKAFIIYFENQPDQMQELIKVVLNLEKYPFKEYGSWILMHLCQSNQFDLQQYYPDLVDVLFKTDNQTVLRNVSNSLVHMKITDYRESEFIDLLIGFIQDYENKVALQVYSIYILIQFVEKYPELKLEIQEIIDLHSEGKTVSYSVARRKFMKQTKKL